MQEKSNEDLLKEIDLLKIKLKKTEKKFEKTTDEKLLLQRITHSIDIDKIMSVLVDELNRIGQFDAITVDVVGDDKESLLRVKTFLPPEYKAMEKTYQKMKIPLNNFSKKIEKLRNGEFLEIDAKNRKTYGENIQNQMDRWRIKHQIVVPLLINQSPVMGELIGIISVFTQHRVIQPKELDPIKQVANAFSATICNAVSFSNLKDKESSINSILEEQQRFLNFISHVNSLESQDAIYELFCNEFIRRFGFDVTGIFLSDGENLINLKNIVSEKSKKNKKSFKEWDDFNRDVKYELTPSDGAIVVSFLQNIHIYVPEVLKIQHLPMSEKDSIGLDALKTPRTLLCMPIRKRGEVIGVFWMWSLHEIVHLSETDINIIDELCVFIGSALYNAELFSTVERQNEEIFESKKEIEGLYSDLEKKAEALRIMATTDKLTGLKNFAYFQEEMMRRINEYQRCAGELFLSLVIVDIDHFKRFNDTYGHVGGNIALEDVASRIKIQSRQMDIPCRYGGEEFIIILPKCDLEGARGFAERLRIAVESKPVKTDAEAVPITISLGCAEYYPNEEMAHFIERADEALYRAKEGGRNRTEVAPKE